jgi:thioredoxin reductase
VKLSDGTYVKSTSVILALGLTGVPVIPTGVRNILADRLILWRHMDEKLRDGHSMVLVVGDGLTAVQAAQYCLRKGKSVKLFSLRTLVE